MRLLGEVEEEPDYEEEEGEYLVEEEDMDDENVNDFQKNHGKTWKMRKNEKI